MAEPVREADRACAVAAAGNKGALIIDYQAGVGRAGIGHHLPRIASLAQVASDELIEPEPLGAGQLDGAVDRRALSDAGQGGGDVIGRLGLEEDGWQRNRPVLGAGIGDAGDELEELRRGRIVQGTAAAFTASSWASLARK